MKPRNTLIVLAAVLLLSTSVLSAQSIISARSGAIHHVRGDAFIDGDQISMEFAKFPNLQEGSTLETEGGLVEMLLTPGVILRLAESSSVKMISSRLSDTRLELVSGSALIEAMELLEDNQVTLKLNDATVLLEKAGLYRLDASPAQLRVYKGRVQVVRNDEVLQAKGGRLVELDGFMVATKFDAKDTDALYRWSSRRSSYLAMANLSAARSMNMSGGGLGVSSWRWNPYFGMMTYVPMRGVFFSPFGYSYFSPSRVYAVYAPPRSTYSGGGGGGFSRGRGTYSATHGYSTVGGRGASTGTVSSSSSGGGSSASAGAASSGGSVSRGSGSSSGGRAGGGRGR